MRSYPLSYQQQALWLLAQIIPAAQQHALNLCYACKLRGRLDVAAMEQAIRALCRRHRILSTKIFIEKGEVWQASGSQQNEALRVLAISGPDRQHAASVAAQLEARTVMDPSSGPLARFTLLMLDPEEHWLLLNIHHLLTDGLSFDLLHRDLAALYSSTVTNTVSALPPLQDRYDSFVAYQAKELLAGSDENEHYWMNRLATDIPTLDLPLDYPRPRTRGFRGSSLSLVLNQALAEECRQSSFQQRVPMSSFLLAAFAVLLHSQTRQCRMTIGTSFVGRRQGRPWRDVAGLFANTVPIQLHLDERSPWSKLLHEVNHIYTGAYDHQEYPFQLLMQKIAPLRDLQRPALFQVAFDFQAGAQKPVSWAHLAETGFERILTPSVIFEFLLHVTDSARLTTARFDYCTDLFSEKTVAAIAEQYVQILEAIVKDPSLSLEELALSKKTPVLEPRMSTTGYHLSIH